jgi:hypothetical protein
VIYVDASVALSQLMFESRSPPQGLWEQPLISSRLLAYAFERVDDVVGQQGVKVLWDAKLPGQNAEATLFWRADKGPQTGQRFARLGDNDLLTGSGGIDHARQLGLGRTNIDRAHRTSRVPVSADLIP